MVSVGHEEGESEMHVGSRHSWGVRMGRIGERMVDLPPPCSPPPCHPLERCPLPPSPPPSASSYLLIVHYLPARPSWSACLRCSPRAGLCVLSEKRRGGGESVSVGHVEGARPRKQQAPKGVKHGP